MRKLKKIYRGWELEGVESYVRKGQNGRESLRRLKPTAGCNPSKRRKEKKKGILVQSMNRTFKL